MFFIIVCFFCYLGFCYLWPDSRLLISPRNQKCFLAKDARRFPRQTRKYLHTFFQSWQMILLLPDVNECHTKHNSCADVGGICINRKNQGSDCSCYSGFEKIFNSASNTLRCQDVDECAELCSGPYDNCKKTVGSYECTCISPSYRMSTEEGNCTDVDECEENACPNALMVCNNTIGSYSCECKSGYEMDNRTSDCRCPSGYVSDNATMPCVECTIGGDICDGMCIAAGDVVICGKLQG